MCIRDRPYTPINPVASKQVNRAVYATDDFNSARYPYYLSCLLYTSDAADERSSVDLGGRRIIKKKKTTYHVGQDIIINKQQ